MKVLSVVVALVVVNPSCSYHSFCFVFVAVALADTAAAAATVASR